MRLGPTNQYGAAVFAVTTLARRVFIVRAVFRTGHSVWMKEPGIFVMLEDGCQLCTACVAGGCMEGRLDLAADAWRDMTLDTLAVIVVGPYSGRGDV